MRTIFKDSHLQEKIDKDGYVVIPFLNAKEVAQIKSIYDGLDAAVGEQFYLSIWSKSEKYKGETHDKIINVIREKSAVLFDNYKHVVSNFAVKFPGDKSEFDLHQGINFVDESQFISITMWIPLQDVFPENGNMQVIRGSHKFFNQDVRSQHYQTPYEKIKPYIKEKYLENLPMKVGEAWIFNHRLLHCSPVNKTDKVRIATLNVLVPAEAKVLLYFKNKDDFQEKEVEILEFTEDNYHLQDVSGKPVIPGIVSIGTAKEIHYDVSPEEFDDLYKKFNA